MLDWIDIQNYRLFNHLRVEGLGRVNLITGTNNVGKSALLEAIYLHSNDFDAATFNFTMGIRGEIMQFWEASRELPEIDALAMHNIFYLFPHFVDPRKKEIIVSSKRSNKIVTNKMSLLIGDPVRKDKPKVEIKSTDKILINGIIDSTIEDFFNKTIKTNLTPLKASYIPHFAFARDFDSNIFDFVGTNTEMLTVLNDALRILDPKISSLNFISRDQVFGSKMMNGVHRPGSRVACFRTSDSRQPILASSWGGGVQRLILIMLTIIAVSETDGERVVFIDEIENGLHYTVQPKLWEIIFKLAHELNVQVFATTHSLDAVRAFSEVANANNVKDDGVIIKLFRKNDGEIKAIRFDEKDLRVSVEVGLELR